VAKTTRINFTLEEHTGRWLKTLAIWEHRSMSSQIDHLVTQAIRSKKTELADDPEASAHFMAQLNGEDV